MSLNVGKILGIGQTQAVKNPYKTNVQSNFAQKAFEFGEANPNRPESRSDILGKNLYCLA